MHRDQLRRQLRQQVELNFNLARQVCRPQSRTLPALNSSALILLSYDFIDRSGRFPFVEADCHAFRAPIGSPGILALHLSSSSGWTQPIASPFKRRSTAQYRLLFEHT